MFVKRDGSERERREHVDGCMCGRSSHIWCASHRDTMNLPKKTIKYKTKNNKINYSHLVIYPYIPVIPLHGYVVCRGVPKSTTVPVPAKPVTSYPWVFLYL